MDRLSQVLDQRDRLILAVIALGAPLESLLFSHSLEPALTIAGPAVALALLPRERIPLLGPIAAQVVLAVAAAWGGSAFWQSTVIEVAWFVSTWRIGRDNADVQAVTGFLATAALLTLSGVVAPSSAGLNPVVAVFTVAGCGLAGAVVRRGADAAADLAHRASTVARGRAARTREAAAAERRRISRELHDVVAHTVTVMTVQAGGARMLLDVDSARAEEAVRAVEAAGRQALGDLRRMVDVIGAPAGGDLEPQPGLGTLDKLVEQMRSAGLCVDVTIDGSSPRLGSGLDLAAYRIVQEALTNALRHGRGTAALVVRYSSDSVAVELVNDRGERFSGGSGSGLVGVRERVALYGGSIDVGEQPDGRFALRARLPVAAS